MPEYRALRDIRRALAPPPQAPPPPDADATDLRDFAETNPDPATWTNTQLRVALLRLIRIELRRRGLVA